MRCLREQRLNQQNALNFGNPYRTVEEASCALRALYLNSLPANYITIHRTNITELKSGEQGFADVDPGVVCGDVVYLFLRSRHPKTLLHLFRSVSVA